MNSRTEMATIAVVLSFFISIAQGVPQLYQYSEPTAVTANSSPRIQSQGEVFRAEVGDTLLLPCKVANLGPMILLWKKGTRVLTAGAMKVRRDKRINLQGTDLQIKAIEKDDGGEYICELETDDDQPIAIVHTVEILVPPSIETEPSNGQIVVKKGTTVSFTCSARGNPTPVIVWKKRNENLPKGDISNGGTTLTLNGVTRHHAGVYECQASNGVGEPAVEAIHLQVLYPPEVKAERESVHGGVGHQVELVCVVYSEPLADVLWYKDTMLLDTNGRRYMQTKGNRHTLLIREVNTDDFGNYSCSASNMLGKARAHLRIRGNPNTPRFNSHVVSKSRTSYRLSWITESYAAIEEYRLLYRKLPDDPTQDVLYAYNNMIISGAGTHGYEHHQSYILENLMPDSMYEAQIQARNSFGWSPISEKFQFYTRGHDSPAIESSHVNPATAQEYGGINSAGSLWRSLYTVMAVFTIIFSYLMDQLWSTV